MRKIKAEKIDGKPPKIKADLSEFKEEINMVVLNRNRTTKKYTCDRAGTKRDRHLIKEICTLLGSKRVYEKLADTEYIKNHTYYFDVDEISEVKSFLKKLKSMYDKLGGKLTKTSIKNYMSRGVNNGRS